MAWPQRLMPAYSMLCRTIPNEANAIQTSKDYSTIPHLAGSEQDLVTAKAFLRLLQTEFGVKTDSAAGLPVYDAGSQESQAATLGLIERTEPSAWIDQYYPGARPLRSGLHLAGPAFFVN